jgi:hypothetical protein
LLITALDGGEWSVLRPGHFSPGEMAPNSRRIGDQFGTWFDLGVMEGIMSAHDGDLNIYIN